MALTTRARGEITLDVMDVITYPDAAPEASPVAAEVVERRLGQIPASVYAVHELQRPVGVGRLAARFEPVHETFRLFREADAQKSV